MNLLKNEAEINENTSKKMKSNKILCLKVFARVYSIG